MHSLSINLKCSQLKTTVSICHLYSYQPLHLASHAESPLILIPALQRAVGEWFEKGVECFIPTCNSKVNYRCNQFHETRQWFYDVEQGNGGLQFQSE